MPSGNNGGQLSNKDPTGAGQGGLANGINNIGGYHPNYNGTSSGNSPEGWAIGDTHPGINPHSTFFDSNMGQFGGNPGAANQIAGQYLMQGDDFAHRQISDANAAQGRWNQGQDRNQQTNALAMQQAAAMGQVPSAANINQGSALSAGLASQLGAAHAGGLMSGLGSHAAMAQGAGLANAAINQGGNARANELSMANRGYMGAAGSMRGSDIGALGLDQQREAEEARLNQQGQLGSETLANQALTNQLNADSTSYNTLFGVIAGQNQAIQKSDREYGRNLMGAGVGAGAGVLGAYGKLSGQYGSPIGGSE